MCTDLRCKPPVDAPGDQPRRPRRRVGRRPATSRKEACCTQPMTISLGSLAMRRRPILLTVLLALALLASAAPAEAAKRKVPFGFFGTVLNDTRRSAARRRARRADGFHGPKRCRVGALLLLLEHGRASPRPLQLRPLRPSRPRGGASPPRGAPIVLSTPRWASSRPLRRSSISTRPGPPAPMRASCGLWSAAMGPVARSGAPRARPKVSIRSWQIWNEPAADFFWATRPWPPSYTRLLKPAYRAIKRADRGATVVLGSLAGVTRSSPWAQMRVPLQVGSAKVLQRHLAALLLVVPVGADHGQADAGDRQPDPARDAPRPRPQEADLVHRAHVDRRSGPDPARRPAGLRDHPEGTGGAPERGVQPPRA